MAVLYRHRHQFLTTVHSAIPHIPPTPVCHYPSHMPLRPWSRPTSNSKDPPIVPAISVSRPMLVLSYRHHPLRRATPVLFASCILPSTFPSTSHRIRTLLSSRRAVYRYDLLCWCPFAHSIYLSCFPGFIVHSVDTTVHSIDKTVHFVGDNKPSDLCLSFLS